MQAVGGRQWQELCYGCSSSMLKYRECVGLLGSQLGEGAGEAHWPDVPQQLGGPAVKLEMQQEEEEDYDDDARGAPSRPAPVTRIMHASHEIFPDYEIQLMQGLIVVSATSLVSLRRRVAD